MDRSALLLSRITAYSKYQRYHPGLLRKETWSETIKRNKDMHLTKYQTTLNAFPDLRSKIDNAYKMVEDYKILPSMRSMQFAGLPITNNNARMYNCSYLPVTDINAFSEIVYLLLCGWIGYSVQYHHIRNLPPVYLSDTKRYHLIMDSIEGWADAVKFLFNCYMNPNELGQPQFDARLVRKRGAIIKSINLPARPGSLTI